MGIRSNLRVAGVAVLATAMAITMVQGVGSSPAQADDGPLLVITSTPLVLGSPDPRLIAKVENPTTPNAQVDVDNPGGTVATAPECVGVRGDELTFCLGASTDWTGGDSSPFVLNNGFTAPGDLPGDSMDWILDEAYGVTADVHGVVNDDLVKAFARPQVRAHVKERLEDIVNKKLYGKPMTSQETGAFDALEQLYKQSQIDAAKASLTEYQKWDKGPCAYVPPAPPAGSGLPVVANPGVGTAMCSAAAKLDPFKFTRNTPSVETFETWASYRQPKAMMRHANDPAIRYMIGKDRGAAVALGAIGAATLAGLSIGVGASSLAAAGSTLSLAIWMAANGAFPPAAAGLVSAAAAAVAGPAIIVAAALVILCVSVWQFSDDLKTGEQITDRATRAVTNTDPLGVRSRIADYTGLDFIHRADPAGQDAAIVHTKAFKDGLEAQVSDWMMFDQGGDPLMDPQVGYTVTESAANDIHFAENGNAVPSVDVKAPAEAVDREGHPVSAYRVLFSRSWPMVSERRSDTNEWSPYRPRLTLEFLDQNGKLAQMSLLRHQEGDHPTEIDFQVTRPDLEAPARFAVTKEWTFTKPDGAVRTVSLVPFDTVLKPVNVVPSAQGLMITDNVVRLDANLSDPGKSLPGSYTWKLERLKDDGTVAETIDLPGQARVFKRLGTAGRYRATASYRVDGPPTLTRSGVVEFTMTAPAPEVIGAKVRDDRVLDGSLFLDLRLLQQTRSDTFTVDVDWADDAAGHVISKTYKVQCPDTGGEVPTCDTGPMALPGEGATNDNWSEQPVFKIPADQDFLPLVTVKVTNSYGQTTTRSFPIEGDHRPKYATQTPSVQMPAGTFSRVDVVEVFPSPLLPDQELTILPYVQMLSERLPAGVHADIEKRDGHWYLQVAGEPQADAIGPYTFYFPVEQFPLGDALRPAPALVNLEVTAASKPGYRSVLRGTPSEFLDRQYRNEYPDYTVQVAQVLDDDDADFGTFTGTVKCKLTAGPRVVFDKVCEDDEPFPWPTERISDTMVASTYVESSTQPISADGPYSVDLFAKFVDPKITQLTSTAYSARFALSLRDLNIVLPPFAAKGYTVTCSQDGGGYAPCFDDGTLSLPRVPGSHTLIAKVVAPDGATSTTQVDWSVAAPKATFTVQTIKKPVRRGMPVLIGGAKLLPGESYSIWIDGRQVGTGTASAAGLVTKWVTVPKATKLGKVVVLIRGVNANRSGTTSLTVIK